MKGIPSRVPTSGFRSPSLTSSPMTNRTPIASRIRKDGGIKLLDINEQPLGYAQAKRRKRLQEIEEQQKKAEEAKAAATTPTPATPTTEAPTTPEYAQGLAPITTPATPASTATTTTALPQPYSTPISTTVPVAVVAPIPQSRKCYYFLIASRVCLNSVTFFFMKIYFIFSCYTYDAYCYRSDNATCCYSC